MATVTKTGAMGGATFSFDFDDVSLQIIAVHVNNQDPRTLNIDIFNDDGSLKNTFSVAPGQPVDRNLTPPQRRAYTVVIVPRSDGTTRVMFSFPHRIYFS